MYQRSLLLQAESILNYITHIIKVRIVFGGFRWFCVGFFGGVLYCVCFVSLSGDLPEKSTYFKIKFTRKEGLDCWIFYTITEFNRRENRQLRNPPLCSLSHCCSSVTSTHRLPCWKYILFEEFTEDSVFSRLNQGRYPFNSRKITWTGIVNT